mmetsp:Transcript_1311/g.819  ORF Transcript_1311/g.819 Transcript_1311/m.819 type:complete len:94 (-) Transcript_1311:32-313(-)
MRLGCRILFDLAARVQDLLQFKYNAFAPDEQGGGIFNWTTQKTREKRFGYLTPETMKLLKDVQVKLSKNDNDLIFGGLTGASIKNKFSRFFKY